MKLEYLESLASKYNLTADDIIGDDNIAAICYQDASNKLLFEDEFKFGHREDDRLAERESNSYSMEAFKLWFTKMSPMYLESIRIRLNSQENE